MTENTDPHKQYATLREMEIRFGAVQEATRVALASINERLEGHNKFREALERQELGLVTRRESEVQTAAIQRTLDSNAHDIRDLLQSKALLEGKASQASVQAGNARVISLIGIIIAALGLVAGLFRSIPR